MMMMKRQPKKMHTVESKNKKRKANNSVVKENRKETVKEKD